MSDASSLALPIALVSVTYSEFDDENREFLPTATSSRPNEHETSNVLLLKDEFNLDECDVDSRQLSVDHSTDDSHPSDIGMLLVVAPHRLF